MSDYSEDAVEVESRLVGSAKLFMTAVNEAWLSFRAYEIWQPIAEFTFGNGDTISSEDWDDIPRDIFLANAKIDDASAPANAHEVRATVFGSTETFIFEVTYLSSEDRLLLEFYDGSRMKIEASFFLPTVSKVTNWAEGIETGSVQRDLERAVTLAELSQVVPCLPMNEQQTAESLLALLSDLSRTTEPPRGVVHEASKWLRIRAEIFIDEAIKSAGKATGIAVAGAGGFLLEKYLPELARVLREVERISRQ